MRYVPGHGSNIDGRYGWIGRMGTVYVNARAQRFYIFLQLSLRRAEFRPREGRIFRVHTGPPMKKMDYNCTKKHQ